MAKPPEFKVGDYSQVTNPASIDPIAGSFSNHIAFLERELKDPSVTGELRAAFEKARDKQIAALQDWKKSATLWDNLRQARTSGNEERVRLSERAVADYLTEKLSKETGRKYPDGMSLEQITNEYQKTHSGTGPR